MRFLPVCLLVLFASSFCTAETALPAKAPGHDGSQPSAQLQPAPPAVIPEPILHVHPNSMSIRPVTVEVSPSLSIQDLGKKARKLLRAAVGEKDAQALAEFKETVKRLETGEHDPNAVPALQELLKTLRARLEINKSEDKTRHLSSKEAMEATLSLFDALNNSLICEQSATGVGAVCLALPKEIMDEAASLLPRFYTKKYSEMEPGELNHWEIVESEAKRSHRLFFRSGDGPAVSANALPHLFVPSPRPVHVTPAPVIAPQPVILAVPTLSAPIAPLAPITVNVRGGNAQVWLVDVAPDLAATGRIDVAGGNSKQTIRVAPGQRVEVYLNGGNTVLNVPESFRNKGHVFYWLRGGNSSVRYYAQ